jgi:CRISPR-associated protein Csx10
MQPGQEFQAAVIGDHDVLTKFCEYFKEAQMRARLGRSKNTQYGLVELNFGAREFTVIEELLWVPIELAEFPTFTITCLSAVILLNQWGRTQLNESLMLGWLKIALEKFGLHLTPDQITIKRSFVRTVDVENWVSVWNARKPSIHAFQMGSCFLLQINKPLTENELIILNRCLAHLQQAGIGTRLNEGFGRIAINWQQNQDLQVILKAAVEKRHKEIIEQRHQAIYVKPARLIPDLLKYILVDTIQHYYQNQIIREASEQLHEFCHYPPGALIGRLQALALNAHSEADFVQKLDQLKDTAKAHLKRCRTHSYSHTLFSFLHILNLSGMNGYLEGLLDLNSPNSQMTQKEIEICQLIGYHPLQDGELKKQLYQAYYQTFFALMRKHAKKEVIHAE